MSRSKGWCLAAVVLLAAGCEKDAEPKVDPRLKVFDEKAAKEAPKPPPAAAGPEANDDEKPGVRLRWQVAKDQPLRLEAQVAPVTDKAELDLQKLAKTPPSSDEIGGLLTAKAGPPSKVIGALEPLSAEDFAVRLKAELAPKASGTGPLFSGVKALADVGVKRANMSGNGFVTTDLERNLRNLLAVTLELPNEKVTKDAAWRSTFDVLSPPVQFVGTSEDRSHQVKLVALEKATDGAEVAVVEYAIAEFQAGKVGKDEASVGAAFVGRGRFRVGEGRWESLQGRLVTRGTGALASSSDEVLTVSVGGAVPEELQKDPPEPEQKIRIPDDHEEGGEGHDDEH